MDTSESTIPELRTKKWPVIGVVLAFVWLFVKGTRLSPLNLLGTFLVGLTVGLFVAYLTRNIYTEEVAIGALIGAVPSAVRYLLLFLKELLTANIDVAYRAISPSLPIDPDVVAIPLRVETDAAITSIANSITLTPGTLTLDYEEETNTLFVHAISGKDDYRSIVDPIRAWEDLALIIFDEEANPDDPPPEWPDQQEQRTNTDAKTETETETDRETETGTDRELEQASTAEPVTGSEMETKRERSSTHDGGVEDGE